MRRSIAILPIALLVFIPAHAQQQFQGDQDFYEEAYEEHDQASAAREAQAEANFDAIMIPQNVAPAPKASPAEAMDMPVGNITAPRRHRRGAGGVGGLSGSQTIVAMPPEPGPSVEVPLKEYTDVRKRIKAINKKNARYQGPAVVLGSAQYEGAAIHGALRLKLKLQVTLGRPGKWKTVPLVGDDVVLVKAAVAKKSIPISRRSGFQVWVTRQTGEATVEVELLVPARGPRGSIEYDFMVARTPVTTFSCQFPVAGLEPRLDAAVRSDARPSKGGTLLTATLRPTTRIHLVGFRDLGEAEGQKAKVYTESLNLLSVDEGALDLFTVIRYTILYAGTKEFLIQVPKGMTVVSADGEGAFRYLLETNDQGTLIKGETAFPIRNNYEISLRLHREIPKGGEPFDVPLPHCQGVEREHGWLGVEVPGKLLLKEVKRAEVLAVDVRQLPEEMVRSSVSPILRAYRYHTSQAQVQFTAERLPEKEPESASIDRVRAFTTVTDEGNVMTDMRITLRNRLRHSLTLAVPEGTQVLSTHLDGQKVKPSESEKGRILLPLKRSAGGDTLQAFTLSVVLESKMPALGWFGYPDLRLPTVDLPVSSIAWTVYLPAKNLYTSLEGDIEPQVYTGRGSWHQPSYAYSYQPDAPPPPPPPPGMAAAGPVASAHTGAMPVRIKLPEHGRRLEYSRYWIEKDHPVKVSFFYVRGWMRIPAWMGLACILALGILLISIRFTFTVPEFRPKTLPNVGVGLVVAVFWPLLVLGGYLGIFLGLVLGGVAMAIHRGWFKQVPAKVVEWVKTLPNRFRARKRDRRDWTTGRVFWRILMTIGLCFFGLILLEAGWRLFLLLFNPL
jgi:hypothetical protein